MTTNTILETLESIQAKLKAVRQTLGEVRDQIYQKEADLRKLQYRYSGGESVDRATFDQRLAEITDLRTQLAAALATEDRLLGELHKSREVAPPERFYKSFNPPVQ